MLRTIDLVDNVFRLDAAELDLVELLDDIVADRHSRRCHVSVKKFLVEGVGIVSSAE